MPQKPNINLFIVGAAKSGTTSLYNYLIQHPDVFFPKVKEPNHYSNIDSEDPIIYKNPKPGVFYHNKIIRDRQVYFSLYKNSNKYKIIGDASPSYLWDKESAKRIYSDFHNAKIIIILRNPIVRTFSHYLMNVRSGIEKDEDFLSALKRDKALFPKVWGDGKVLLYEELGLYYEQVKAYFDNFHSKNIKVIIYEDFFKNTEKGLQDIYDFLNIEKSESINHQEVHNRYSSPKNKLSRILIQKKKKFNFLKIIIPERLKNFINKNILFKNSIKPEMSDESKEYLSKIFCDDIKKLEALLGRNINAWK